MDKRKYEKITALLISILVVVLSFFNWNWKIVGIYAGCGLTGRMLYHFFHVNVLHALLNAWCLLSIVFIYNVRFIRMFTAYVIASTIPINAINGIIGGMSVPTVGLSGIVFVLFGMLSFDVLRKWYYQAWMLFYIIIGFIYPNTNAWLHLYCYICGLLIAFLNKPIKIKKCS